MSVRDAGNTDIIEYLRSVSERYTEVQHELELIKEELIRGEVREPPTCRFGVVFYRPSPPRPSNQAHRDSARYQDDDVEYGSSASLGSEGGRDSLLADLRRDLRAKEEASVRHRQWAMEIKNQLRQTTLLIQASP